TAEPNREGLELALGNGLVTNPDYESWLPQRRMIQPMFHRKRIAQMGDKMQAAAADMLARWEEKYAPGDEMMLDLEMTAVTLDIINRTMFSTSGADKLANRVGPAVGTVAEFVFERGRRAFQLPLDWPLPGHRIFRQAQAELDALIDEIINQRRQSNQQYDDLLDMLLAARDEETGIGMSESQLRDEVKTIFAAGHETTSNALTWTWYLLSQHPDVLRRLQAEVDAVLAGRLPNMADLEQLPFTRQVFQESLRLCPPVPFIPRYLPEPVTVNGRILPAPCTILVSVYNIHRHPDFWDEPEQFNPDRFEATRFASQHKYAYIPFGAGPRMCIGNHFAMMEGSLLLATIASRYELRLVPGHPVKKHVAITMRPEHGLKMTIHPR
ncbi:MAG: cytochrome P450, partial [Chloroflexi bacterium]